MPRSIADKAVAQEGGAPEWLDQLTIIVMARITELIHEIPGGSDEERAALAAAVMAEILARALATVGAPSVAQITNAVLDVHRLTWRLVSVS
jgi:hypothetical protein